VGARPFLQKALLSLIFNVGFGVLGIFDAELGIFYLPVDNVSLEMLDLSADDVSLVL